MLIQVGWVMEAVILQTTIQNVIMMVENVVETAGNVCTAELILIQNSVYFFDQ